MPVCTTDEHFLFYFSASVSIFSINIPYPLVGLFTKTCVIAPTNFPFWIIGLPLTSVVNRGEQIHLSKLSDRLMFERDTGQI